MQIIILHILIIIIVVVWIDIAKMRLQGVQYLQLNILIVLIIIIIVVIIDRWRWWWLHRCEYLQIVHLGILHHLHMLRWLWPILGRLHISIAYQAHVRRCRQLLEIHSGAGRVFKLKIQFGC